jgi:hypothetical protein
MNLNVTIEIMKSVGVAHWQISNFNGNWAAEWPFGEAFDKFMRIRQLRSVFHVLLEQESLKSN